MVETKKMRRLLPETGKRMSESSKQTNLRTHIYKLYSTVEKAIATYLSEMTQSLGSWSQSASRLLWQQLHGLMDLNSPGICQELML